MNKYLIIMAAALCGCASQPPVQVSAIKNDVAARITYQHYAARDWRYVAPGETSSGNCAVFAYTAFTDASKAGLEPQLHICRTPRGEQHAYTQVGEWAIDNRFRWVIPMAEQDCK